MSLHSLIERICKYLHISIILKRDSSYNTSNNTAVKSRFGFWYIGDIFNRQDTVYGILQNGAIESTESDAFVRLLGLVSKDNTAPIVYDIGANTGYYSLLSTSAEAKATVHAFEPIPTYTKRIQENITLNKVDDRVSIHNIGLSDTNGTATLHLAGTGSTLEKDFQPDATESLSISIHTLDSYIPANSLPLPQIMKIDVENHELSMLKGATEIIKAVSPILFIEIIDTYGSFTNTRFTETLQYINDLNYKMYILDQDGKYILIEDVSTYHSDKIEMYTCIPTSSSYVIGA
jgi:FkbM family methyltransferase